MSKFQVPTVGGIRKVIRNTDNTSAILTTISEAIAQLAALVVQLQTPVNTGGGNIGTGNEASIQLGPGLAGGGVLVGNVPINLTIPTALFVEDGVEGDPGPPGIQGPQGKQGIQGIPGFFGEDGADGDNGIQGVQGIQGIQGVVGSQGAQGIPGGAWFAEDSLLDESILDIPMNMTAVFTWSGTQRFIGNVILGNTFQTTAINIGTSSGLPLWSIVNSSGGTDSKNWDNYADTTTLHYRAVNDSYQSANDWLTVVRSGFVITSVTVPNCPLIAPTHVATAATPAAAAGQTAIGTTTTGTVITTAGGIALPALASTFWVVNVNGVAYGIPCFAL